jgi:hypothetical protein
MFFHDYWKNHLEKGKDVNDMCLILSNNDRQLDLHNQHRLLRQTRTPAELYEIQIADSLG